MDKTLILAVSFGTTHSDTCQKNIGSVEQGLRDAFSSSEVRRAFTSGMIRSTLEKQGMTIDDVPIALTRAAADGFTRVIIQPTHLLYGDEYEKMCRQAEPHKKSFSHFTIAKPLFAETCDMHDVAKTISEVFPKKDDTALVLMGHGTEHYVNPVYAAMQTVFHLMGRTDVIVGTVEAWPGIDDVLTQLDGTYKSAILTPLMLVAGDHAVNDMAGGEPDSWKTQIEAKGIKTQTVLRGLGEYEGILDIYVRHTRDAFSAISRADG